MITSNSAIYSEDPVERFGLCTEDSKVFFQHWDQDKITRLKPDHNLVFVVCIMLYIFPIVSKWYKTVVLLWFLQDAAKMRWYMKVNIRLTSQMKDFNNLKLIFTLDLWVMRFYFTAFNFSTWCTWMISIVIIWYKCWKQTEWKVKHIAIHSRQLQWSTTTRHLSKQMHINLLYWRHLSDWLLTCRV